MVAYCQDINLIIQELNEMIELISVLICLIHQQGENGSISKIVNRTAKTIFNTMIDSSIISIDRNDNITTKPTVSLSQDVSEITELYDCLNGKNAFHFGVYLNDSIPNCQKTGMRTFCAIDDGNILSLDNLTVEGSTYVTDSLNNIIYTTGLCNLKKHFEFIVHFILESCKHQIHTTKN